MSTLSNSRVRHELVRHNVQQVVCSVCDTVQKVSRLCSNCGGVNMGEYFCEVYKFYDDDVQATIMPEDYRYKKSYLKQMKVSH